MTEDITHVLFVLSLSIMVSPHKCSRPCAVMSQADLVVLEFGRYHVDNEKRYDQLLDAQAMPHIKDMDECTRIENYIFWTGTMTWL